METDFAACGLHHSASALWNSCPRTALNSPSLAVSKSTLQTHLFHLAHNDIQ